MLIVGEVRTGLLHNSGRLSRDAVMELLEIKPGRRVRVTNRPVSRSTSPEVLTGVDCRLPTQPLTKARGIGTVASRAVVIGGLVLQSSAWARLEPAAGNHRRAWSHYTDRPGVIEVISKAKSAQLAAGYRTQVPNGTDLDLGAISEHLVGVVQTRPQLDHRATIRSRPTRVRWSAMCAESVEPAVSLHLDNDVLRTVDLTLPAEFFPFAERFCEDLALHDWLITTLENVIDQVDNDLSVGANATALLGAAVDRLVHLWMPGAHVNPRLCVLWDKLEDHPGFSRQWNAQVAWIRDQLLVRTFDMLDQARRREAAW